MKDSPTKDMRFDVCKIPEEDKSVKKIPTMIPSKKGDTVLDTTVIGHFPELKRIKSFMEYPGTAGEELHKEMTLKYIIILYSEDSILNKEKPLPSLEERMYHAADLAGFKRNNEGEFRDNIVQKLFLLNSNHIVNMALEFLQFQHNDVWTEMMIISHELQEYRRIRMAPVADDKDKDVIAATEKKDKLRMSCDNMVKKLKEYTDTFFKDHTILKDKVKRKRTTLESIAKEQ